MTEFAAIFDSSRLHLAGRETVAIGVDISGSRGYTFAESLLMIPAQLPGYTGQYSLSGIPEPMASATAFKHALCVYPYRRELNDAGFFPPLGLEFIAAALRPYTDAIEEIDLRYEPGNTVDFLRDDTDLVCFSVNWERDVEFLEGELRSIPADLLTVVGGRHATEDPERWLRDFPNVDIVVRGDGEEAMVEICEGAAWEDIAGISFQRDGNIVHNENRHLGDLRDDLYPDRTLRRHKYGAMAKGVRVGVSVDGMTATRGCPYNCKFCSFSLNPWGEKRSWSSRSPESVVDELETIDARVVAFTDDLFTHDMDRVDRICDLIIERKIKKRYMVNARLEIAKRPDVMEKMHKAGFSMLMLGIESSHDKTLKSMQKGFNTDKIREYFQVLRKSKMFLHGYFILGCIGETRKEMEQIVPFAHELGLDTIALSTLRTGLHSSLDELVADSPGYHIDKSGKVYSDECSTRDLRKLRREINKGFYGPKQQMRLLRKGIQNGALSFLPRLLLHSPMVLAVMIPYTVKKKLRRAKDRREKRAAAKLAAKSEA
jgi:anaerobic magnesium-protoporphyrin IX monomethyl ester cyclase